jgi:hypothetical protein
VRAGYTDEDLRRSQRTAEIESAREIAEAWRQAVIAKGWFEAAEGGEEAMNPLDEWDDAGMTPLMNAVFSGDEEEVRRLLQAGADPVGGSRMGRRHSGVPRMTSALWRSPRFCVNAERRLSGARACERHNYLEGGGTRCQNAHTTGSRNVAGARNASGPSARTHGGSTLTIGAPNTGVPSTRSPAPGMNRRRRPSTTRCNDAIAYAMRSASAPSPSRRRRRPRHLLRSPLAMSATST